MRSATASVQMRRLVVAAFALILAAVLAPAIAFADNGDSQDSAAAPAAEKVVRVGWFESPFNTTDQFGRRSGYSYEYQRKLAAYTGWTYEYVEESWPVLLQMLANGEIDLLSDVSYKPDRADKMLFASLPMGSEAYYLYTAAGNKEISASDYRALNGKRIGVNKGSIQKDMLDTWADAHGVEAEVVELTDSEEECMQMLQDGRIDALVTLDVYADPEFTSPIVKIGSSEFFFAVNKDRPDLLGELDAALNSIQDEDRYYNQNLQEKYLSNVGSNLYLTVEEQDWLANHGPIRVGYQDNYLAFCATDPTTGELTGALKDYLAYASTAMANAEIEFEPVAYPTAAATIEALKNGEVDCMFPANLTDYDGETLGLVMTPAIMRTEMDAVVREADQKEFIYQDQVTVAVNEGNTNYEMWLLDNYPNWQVAYFKDTPAGLEAVAAGKADCVIISNYRFSNISKQCDTLHLAPVYAGVDMDYYFAVCEGDMRLYSILSRVANAVPSSVTNAALTYYSTEDVKLTFGDYVLEHLGAVLAVVVAVLLLIILLLLRSNRAVRKASEEHQRAAVLNKRVFVDPLTSVRNKAAFDEFARELQDRLNAGEQLEFAMGVFDCDSLKDINDEFGHDKGDAYLKGASKLICRVFQHSPVFRVGGDEFAVVLENEDYKNREALIEEFRAARSEVSASAENKWDEVHVSMGVVEYDPSVDRSVVDTMHRADHLMYEYKRARKQAAQKG